MKKDAPLVVVIDGQVIKIGRKLCDQLLEGKPELSLLALCTIPGSGCSRNLISYRKKKSECGNHEGFQAAEHCCF